jgi:dihydroxyacetone kinase-like protein
VARFLAEQNVSIVTPLVGRFATSMEMTGASISMLKLDDELEGFLNAPTDCPFWSPA